MFFSMNFIFFISILTFGQYYSSVQAASINLTILHTNDVHSRFTSFNSRMEECTKEMEASTVCFGGAARRLTLVKQLRSQYRNVLLLDGGDHFQGTLWYTIAKWRPVRDMVNLFNYDAMSFGNHEFDDTLEKNDSNLGLIGLAPYLQNVKALFVSTNIDATKSKINGLFEESIVLNRDGEEIGILGYITPETVDISFPGPNIKFYDEVERLTQVANQMKTRGINKIVAIGHSGYDVDKKICAKVPGVDIVIGGHTNTFLYTGAVPTKQTPDGPYPTLVTNVDGHTCLVVQDYAFGKYLGFLQVAFDDQGKAVSWSGNPILINQTLSKDPEIDNALAGYQAKVDVFRQSVIGRTATKLDGMRERCRVEECTFGNIVTDAMVYSYIKKRAESIEAGDTGGTTPAGWAPSAISLVNSAAFRNIEKDPWSTLTMADLYNSIPYANTVELIKLKGKHIWQALERSVEDIEKIPDDPHGKFLQVSGIQVVYNLEKPNNQRVVRVSVKCARCPEPTFAPIELDGEYSVVVMSFLKKGGDGYSAISENLLHADGLETLDIDVLADYIRAHSPLVVRLEGRIKFLKADDKSDPSTCGAEMPGAKTVMILVVLLLASTILYDA